MRFVSTIAVVISVGSAWADEPVFHHLGEGTFALAVSSDANTVVGATSTLAFVWTADGGMINIGSLPEPFGTFSAAYGVSGDGAVVVGAASDLGSPGYPSWAFLWSEAEGSVPMGPPPADALHSSIARAVSYDGSVIAGAIPDGSFVYAFRWTAKGEFQLLGGGVATGMSADGNVLGINHLGLAYRWTEPEGAVVLGVLSGGIQSASVLGVSADGSAMVGASDSGRSSGPAGEAFVWRVGSGMTGLGDLPGGLFRSTARAASRDGSVVVGEGFGEANINYAFIWNRERGMQPLQDVLIERGFDLKGWRLFRATGITPDGRTIVGDAVNPAGNTEAFVASLGSCVADFNGSSTVNSQDFFDFVSSFFAGPVCTNCPEVPCAVDINHDCEVDSRDFFEFLTAFFTGC
jgi:uncharacterized membrane protein